MAICDAKYRFIYFNIGAKGSASDGGVFSGTPFYRKMINNELHLPDDEPLPQRGRNMPYVLVADDAFALHTHIMKPYPKRNLSIIERAFNYRLSRARRTIENSFGILAARFRVFHRTMELLPANIEKIVQASCVLHNFFIDFEKNQIEIDIDPMEENHDVDNDIQTQAEQTARAMRIRLDENRKEFTEYFIRVDERDQQYH